MSEAKTNRATYLKTIWYGMYSRCNNPKNKNYHNYGGRGIKLSGGWENKETFIKDMWDSDLAYKSGISIERINTNGDYCPSNCKTATQKEQCRNQRKTVYIQYKGETINQSDLADKLGMSHSKVKQRYKNYDPARHGNDFDSYMESHVVQYKLKVPPKGNPIVVNGISFDSVSAACRYYGKANTTVSHWVEKFGITVSEALLLTPEDVKRLTPVSKRCISIEYKGQKFDSITQLSQFLGMGEAALRRRMDKYNPEIHGSDFDEYLGQPVKPLSTSVTLFGVTYDRVIDAANSLNMCPKNLSDWLSKLSIEEVERRIKRNTLYYEGEIYRPATLAQKTGIPRTVITNWICRKDGLTPEQLSDKIESYQKGER
jgi:DNA-binding Lrp family transcriptional regulator